MTFVRRQCEMMKLCPNKANLLIELYSVGSNLSEIFVQCMDALIVPELFTVSSLPFPILPTGGLAR